MSESLRRPGPGWRGTLLLFALSFGGYLLFRRELAHGSDILTLAKWMEDPAVVHPHHPLYLQFAHGLERLLRPFGIDRMTMFAVYSALGAALGLAFSHRAVLAWRGESQIAAVVVLTAAATPALTYFATIGELHAPFSGAVGLGWWACAAWAQQPSWRRAMVCGAVGGFAALLHATGVVLGLWFAVAYCWGRRADGWRLLWLPALLCVGSCALVWLLGFFGLRAAGEVLEGQPLELVAERLDVAATLAALPWTLVADWLWPFAPCSLLVVIGWWRGRRGPLLLLHGAVLLHVTFTAVMLRGMHHEFGAYDLPLLLPLVLLTVDVLPKRLRLLLPLLALGASVAHRLAYPQPRPALDFGRAAVAVAAEKPTMFLVGDEMESQGIRWFAPGAELIEAWVFQRQMGDAAKSFTPDQVVGWLQWQLHSAEQLQRRLFVSDLALANLAAWLPHFAAGWQKFAAGLQLERPAAGPAGYILVRS